MKKLMITTLCLWMLLFIAPALNAQINAGSPGNLGNAGNAGSPTSENVQKWTKEVLPKMELLADKLEKTKPVTAKDIETKKTFLKALKTLRTINAKGTRLTDAEARRQDTWFKGIVNSFYIDCQAVSGNVCCVECHNNAILGIWCFANCFIARIPGID